MSIILASLGILLALGSAIAGTVGSGIAAPLEPGYAQKVREFVRVLEPFIWAQRNLTNYFLKSVEQTGALERKELDNGLYAKLKTVAVSVECELVVCPTIRMSTSVTSSTLGTFRFWLPFPHTQGI